MFAPDGSYARCCAICNFKSSPKPEWDESPQPTYCPKCGMSLRKMACRECGDALAIVGGVFGSYFAQYCTTCGADNRPPVEPQMCTKPKKASARSTTTKTVKKAGLPPRNP